MGSISNFRSTSVESVDWGSKAYYLYIITPLILNKYTVRLFMKKISLFVVLSILCIYLIPIKSQCAASFLVGNILKELQVLILGF